MTQIKLDFSKRRPVLDNGKKLKRLSFTCSEEFQEFLDLIVNTQATDRSNLIHRYVLEGMQKDLAEMFLPQPHLDSSLKGILRQGY